MIRFSPAKINLGLMITRKRDDGFHELQSIMLPTPLCDIIEVKQSTRASRKVEFTQSGIIPDVAPVENLCIKAFHLFSKYHPGYSVNIHLHKLIPFGAGLGGGSSNAAILLQMLNDLHNKPFSFAKLSEIASLLGSDCPFFLYNKPMFMTGRGECLSNILLDIGKFYLVIINPGIMISTTYAYQLIKPTEAKESLIDLISQPIHTWKDNVINNFEKPIFHKYPELKQLKKDLYGEGAVYASMSGSGSSIYGIFTHVPTLPEKINKHLIWKGDIKRVTQIQ